MPTTASRPGGVLQTGDDPGVTAGLPGVKATASCRQSAQVPVADLPSPWTLRAKSDTTHSFSIRSELFLTTARPSATHLAVRDVNHVVS